MIQLVGFNVPCDKQTGRTRGRHGSIVYDSGHRGFTTCMRMALRSPLTARRLNHDRMSVLRMRRDAPPAVAGADKTFDAVIA